MDCQVLLDRIHDGFSRWAQVRVLSSGQCVVRLPFWDSMGDPVELGVIDDGDRVTINDAGSIAGLLFSLDQHEEGSPSFRLVEDLEQAHGLKIDYEEGLVTLSVGEDGLYDGIAEMSKVVLAMHTVVPHISVARRRKRSPGPRLTSKIALKYKELQILDHVERAYQIEGTNGPTWTVDFHWSVRRNGDSHGVNVVAPDLGVADPMVKANRVVALSVDTRARHAGGDDLLRVVVEAGGSVNGSASSQAIDFLRSYSDELGYAMFDLAVEDESSEFYAMSVRELRNGSTERERETVAQP